VIEALRARGRWFVARRERPLAALIAVLAGVAVFLIATEVFPYHSSNHDEGVYLQQASMLLEGQLGLFPGELGDSVRPWFFFDAGDRLYPKYQPIPAAFYAFVMGAVGEPRVALAAVAAGNTALVYVLGSMAFDRRVGVLAAATFALAPMTLVTSSVFLPYAPTTLFTLLFAVVYLHAARTRSVRTAALAGFAVGVAFFMRPFTAVLFAAPFVGHALLTLARTLRDRSDGSVRTTLRGAVGATAVRRNLATAAVGLVFVALSLSYNVAITGDALVFPYEAFAPEDGPGFGHREILSHSTEYTPALAVQANGYVVGYLLTRWVFAGALGTALAAVGLVAAVRRWTVLTGDALPQCLLAALFVSVPAGNVLFWGNYNILETMSDPTDGLLGQFGPFYHFDLLAPVAIFTAAGAVALWRIGRRRIDEVAPTRRSAVAGTVGLLLGGALILGGFNAALAAGPLDRNAAQTATYEDAYDPFENRSLENAVVFLPTPYGEWLNHPFQYLRNDPGFDGDVVYAMDRGPSADFAVLDRYPDRQQYRYDFRGEWTADPDDRRVRPTLHPIAVRSSPQLAGRTRIGVPDRVSHATIRIETGAGHVTREVDETDDSLEFAWRINPSGVALTSVDGAAVESEAVATLSPEEVVIQVRLSQPAAGSLTYRQELTVRERGDEVDVVWPPERTVCPVVDDCGREGTYLPGDPRGGLTFETFLR
jgi:4-amino-4-deoxy-L-arabinose transferase-like glycosyltransferase